MVNTKLKNIVKITSLLLGLTIFLLIYSSFSNLLGGRELFGDKKFRTCGSGTNNTLELNNYLSKSSNNELGFIKNQGANSALKKDMDFGGLTYTPEDNSREFFQSDPCEELTDKATDIVLVNNETNQIIKLYISTVFSNETEFLKTQELLNSNNFVKEMWLYQDIRGGFEKPEIDPEKFKVETNDELDASRDFADSLLTIDCLNELRKMKTPATGSSKEPRILTDDEIFDIIFSARKLAITEARASYKK